MLSNWDNTSAGSRCSAAIFTLSEWPVSLESCCRIPSMLFPVPGTSWLVHQINLTTKATSTVYWCIASKLKVPLFFYGMNKTFLWVDLSFFNQSYSGITTTKSLPDIGGTFQDVGQHLAVMRAAMEPGVHTMSDELILQISRNIFLAFKLILMMTSGKNILLYTTAKLSVPVWNHDLIWWRNKIDTQNHFRKTTITSFWTLSKTKISITIVKAHMPSNPNQKSRTRDNK